MDEKEYLQTLGEQIVNPHARASILAEIQDHIEEQAQDYRASGMSEAVAMQEAVRQMGDPVSTGEALNQVHRPKFPIALFGLAVVLTVLGIAMQYLVYTHLTPDTAILSDTYLQRTILYNAIGLGLLLLCIFGNYMYLAKGAWILLAIFLLGLLPPWFFGFYGRQYTLCYYLALVYPLVYALLLYRLRDKGAKAIWFLHGLTLLFLVRMLFGTIITWSTVLAAGCLTLLLLCLAIHRGILTGSPKRTLWLLTVLPYVAAAACFVILFFQNSYMRDRLTEFLKGSGYVQQMLALEQQQMLAFGGGTISSYVDTESLASTYVLHSIFLWFGIVSGILVIVALAVLVLRSLHYALHQSNRLALLTGTAASGILLFELLHFVLTNLGCSPVYTASVPFLSYGFANSVFNSLLVGIMLGVIRNQNVLSETTASLRGLRA